MAVNTHLCMAEHYLTELLVKQLAKPQRQHFTTIFLDDRTISRNCVSPVGLELAMSAPKT